jgi:hypothetical protein
MLQIVASLIDAARGVIYDHHMFIVQASGLIKPARVKIVLEWRLVDQQLQRKEVS